MTTDQPDPNPQAISLPGETAVALGDLTARARIRQAALRHFAEQGFQRATIRKIAQTAGVSPGLLRHHFGSKDDLRKECDEYVSEMLRRLNAQLLSNPGDVAGARRA
ncbi:MAG: helix-turn-helix domain-containing protein, partial [Streptosporangiaceae bacterium]